MNMELLRELGNYAGLVAVLVAIVSLTSQVRRHTQSLQSQNYAKALERLGATQARLGTDPRASRVLSLGVREPAALTRGERVQFAWMFYEIFGTFEFMFHEARAGRLPAQIWGRWAQTLGWWISLPGVQAWWESKPTPFSPRFSAFVDGCIASPVVDQVAAERWLTFLAGGQEETLAPPPD